MPHILEKAPTPREVGAALLRFAHNRRNHPEPTLRHSPTVAGEWARWKEHLPLRCTDGCVVQTSGDKCEHGHPTYFLRYFLDLGV